MDNNITPFGVNGNVNWDYTDSQDSLSSSGEIPFLNQDIQEVQESDQLMEEVDAFVSEQIFPDLNAEEYVERNKPNIEDLTDRKRSHDVMEETFEAQPLLKKARMNPQAEISEENIEKIAEIAIPQFFGATILETIENALVQGDDVFVALLKMFPNYLTLKVDVPSLQTKIFQHYGYGMPGLSVLLQLSAAKHWDLIGSLLQAKVPLILNECYIFSNTLLPISPFCMAIADHQWDVATMMLEAPYKPYIGLIKSLFRPEGANIFPVEIAIINKQWNLIKKMLAYDPQALNVINIRLPGKFEFSADAIKNLFEIMQDYPVSSTLISKLFVQVLGRETEDQEVQRKIIEIKPDLHMNKSVFNFMEDIDSIEEHKNAINNFCEHFNVDSVFTQEILGKIFQDACQNSDLWSERIEIGREIFYRAVFRKMRVANHGISIPIKELLACSREDERVKSWADNNVGLWNRSPENQVMLKPVLNQISTTQRVMEETFQALFYATAAHADNPLFDSLPHDVYRLIAQEVFQSTPELTTLPLSELMETLGQWNRYGKGQIAAAFSIDPAHLLLDKETRCDAKNGHPHAVYELAMAQMNIPGLTQTQYNQTVDAISVAANQGDVNAQCQLAWLYLNSGVENSMALAMQWYRTAANQGNAYALEQLEWFKTI